MIKIFKEKSNLTNNEFFIIIFECFIIDNQKYIRLSALEIFGKFIFELNKNELKKEYLDFYIKYIQDYYNQINEIDNQLDLNFYENVNNYLLF